MTSPDPTAPRRPEIVYFPLHPSDTWVCTIRCPSCGMEGDIDRDQFEGRVSIQCPNCAYHETHNLNQRV